jgi:hypothetical protein
MGAAGSVGDSPVERLERETLGRVPGDERMEPATQPIHLDDVPCLDALEPHDPKLTSARGRPSVTERPPAMATGGRLPVSEHRGKDVRRDVDLPYRREDQRRHRERDRDDRRGQ